PSAPLPAAAKAGPPSAAVPETPTPPDRPAASPLSSPSSHSHITRCNECYKCRQLALGAPPRPRLAEADYGRFSDPSTGCSTPITAPYSLLRISKRSAARVTYRTSTSIPDAAGRRSTLGAAENWLSPCTLPELRHSASASFVSCSVCFATTLSIAASVLCWSAPVGTFSVISSHIHCPAVEKLKNCPVTAKLFMNITRRPVGWPLSVQLPVSSSVVRMMPTSSTSPATPLISTQSPTRMPFLPISTNHPKNARMKS